ncbi:MAG: hypothetical protein BWY65_01909 [Firmicutes bacterium ADurb.Bin373]|nr:MAG: hypothetical protein BWY65_01909 [Firmicutes bacterium ADurb.Bin373]
MQINLSRIINYVILAAVLILIVLGLYGARLYTDWLWFQSLNYQRVFTTIILSKAGLRFAVGFILFLFLFINLYLTRGPLLKATQKTKVIKEDDLLTIQNVSLNQLLTPRFLLLLFVIISLAMAVLFNFSVAKDWIALQQFLHPSNFGVNDPVFQKDVGFYVFQLPFYIFLYNVASMAVLVTAFWVTIVYLAINFLQGNPGRLLQDISARYHLSFLAAVFFIIKAVGYRLEQYMLLFSHRGAVWGPGYTTTHATLVAYKVLAVIALVCALAILINLFLRKFRLVVYSIGVLLVASIALGGLYPAFIQKFVVTPNEAAIERPYLEKNIQFARMAYDLDKIEKKDFPAGRILRAEDIQANQDTVGNIRLWDWEQLKQTYGQLQEIRLYYEFPDIDIDRYTINGSYRQVMLAPRELNQEHLTAQAKTWVNQRLFFTHGYGIAMSPVNELTTEGLPTFFLKDIPPTGNTDLKVERPEIYFGERTDQDVLVNTKSQEFNYPQGDVNVLSTYEGESGVKVNNFLRRVMFALALGDYKILLSSEIDNNSRVLYYRNIKQRVPKIAPFLQYDNDPYIVLSNGKLYWMWDAYTITNKFPYSEPFDKVNNYIRNSVKIVVDAYTGQIDFYISNESDPLIQTYSKIFPGMFKSLEEMPEDLHKHIRYPVDLFRIQAEMYGAYHMEDPLVFYNREDKWNIASETMGSEEKQIEPYYTIIKMPGEDKPEFVLILPFTPQNKKNMIAWMAARSDGDNYGTLLSYNFPKQELVYGPTQIEARLNQDTLISQQLSLWNQHGSSVIRGNLLVIPVKDALVYVAPIYLQAEQSKMPELRRVIVAHGEKVVMEPTLEIALEKIFGEGTGMRITTQAQQPETGSPAASISDLAQSANQLYDEAQNKLRNGDWAGYGESLNKLKQTLAELVARVEDQP